MRIRVRYCTNHKKIRSSWLKYFQRLYKPIFKAEYDSGHKITVDDIIDKLLGEDFNDQPNTFSVDEIMAMCRSLKKNKAAGWDSCHGRTLHIW